MNLSTFGLILLTLTVIHAKHKFHESLSPEELKHYFGTNARENVPDYDIVHPVHLSGSRHRRSINSPKSPLEYQIHALGEKYLLKLTHNDHLIAPGCLVTTLGGEKKVVPCPVREHDCYYHGHSENHENSTVAVSACDGLHGIISTPSHDLVLQPIRQEHRNEVRGDYPVPHIAYRNVAKRKKRCALQSTADNIIASASRRLRRATGTKYIEMLLVADKTMYQFHKDDLTRYMLTAANIAAGRYLDKSLGTTIHLTIIKIQILEDDVPGLTIVEDADATLTNFCKWQEKTNPERDSNPGHVDAASLMTKIDLIHMGVRSTTGLATVAGMCTPNIRCSVIEDDGLDLGLTLAHETGHSLNMHHDGEGNSCTDLTNIMSSGGGGGPGSFKWSSCSVDYMNTFFSQGKGNCLNDEPQGKLMDFPKDLPGVIYDGEEQCRMFIGDGSSLCTGTGLVDQFGGDECAKLICHDPKHPGMCSGSQTPRMDGTMCGQRKWCQHGKCEDIGPNGPKPRNGGWSDFSQDWTECSRTCGGGVRYTTRKCNNPKPLFSGKDCEGSDVRAELCNLQPCSTSQLTYKKEQCAATDSVPMFEQLYHWIPQYTADQSQCQLYCRPEGQGTVQMRTLDGSQNYKDGTECTAAGSSYARCVAGKCMAFGCDGVSDSTMKADTCGVCNGNGNTCSRMTGKYTKGEGQKYVTFLKLSKGTNGILITNKNRYSVLSLSVRGSRILNKVGGQRDKSNTYSLGGVTVKYRPYPEKLEVVGTLTEDAEAQVYRVYGDGYQGAEPDVTYEYYVPKNPNAPKKYVWKATDGACSVTCGSGRRQTEAVCVKAGSGATVDNYLCTLADKPSSVGKPCTMPQCPSSWQAGSFGQCSKSCNGGTQSRVVKCIRSGETVADGQCRGNKPSVTQKCNTMTCPGEWRTLEWTQCSKTCSRGVQTRAVKCYMNNKEVSDSKCLPSNKPVTSQSCLTAACNTDVTGDACADKAECKDYDINVCADYEEWAQTNCMAKCGYCTASGSVSSGVCEDKSADCKDYGESACSEYKEWASENCASFCGFCKSTGGQSGQSCSDKDETTCKEYGKDACTKWPEWAQKNCASMCNLCGGGASVVTTKAPSTGTGECKDVDEQECIGQGKSACTEYAEWAHINCAKFCNFCGGSSGQDSCVDKSDQCSGYDDTMCEDYKEWAEKNCQKRCNFCEGKATEVVEVASSAATVPATTAKQGGACEDTADCAAYGSTVCTDYEEWAGINCKRTCGKCGGTTSVATSPAASDCADLEDCSAYGASVCTQYGEWAAINCKKFCKQCSSGEAETTKLPTTTTTKATTTTTTSTTTTATTTTTTPVPSTTTVAKEVDTACSDKADCGAYGESVCTQYAEWAVLNCAQYCGHCDTSVKEETTKATVAVDPNCKDVRADCEGYGKSACTDYAEWAKTNCKAFCGFCGDEVETTPKAVETTPKPTTTTTIATTQRQTTANSDPGCVDVSADCEGYGKSACTEYAEWAHTNCKRFCGFCDSEVTTAVVESTCKDSLDNCAAYGASACTQYAEWAGTNCQKFCNLCDSSAETTAKATTTQAIAHSEAVDASSSDACADTADCKAYGESVCTDYGEWATINCKKYCGICTVASTCEDKADCAAYGASVCTDYGEWATINCQKYCKQC